MYHLLATYGKRTLREIEDCKQDPSEILLAYTLFISNTGVKPAPMPVMDIVGPLPRSFEKQVHTNTIIVICHYTTRFPEAIPLKTIDASRIAHITGAILHHNY